MAVTTYAYSQTVANGGTVAMPTGSPGWFRCILGDNGYRAFGVISSAGAVTLIYASAGVYNTDTAGGFCIFDNSGTPTFKNNTGASATLFAVLKIGDATDTLADDATATLDTYSLSSYAAWGTVAVENPEAYCNFWIDGDTGSCRIVSSLGSVDNADTDGSFCVYPALGGVYAKNRLGASKYYNTDYEEGTSASVGDDSILTETWSVVGRPTNSAAGYGFVAVAGSAYAHFTWNAAGAVTIVESWGAVANSNTDGFLCIYPETANYVAVKNRLGSTKTIYYAFYDAASMAITDTEAHVRAIMDGDSDVNAMTWCETPTEAHYNHSRLYRRSNAGTWNYLRTDGTWNTTGTVFEFNPTLATGELSYTDEAKTDAAWEYKWTHVTNGGIESGGTITAVEYIDEPVIAIAAYGNTSTDDRGVQVSLTADSGNDSSNTAYKCFKIRLQEVGQADYYDFYTQDLGAGPWILPFVLSTGTGTKTIRATGFDRAGQYSGYDEVAFDYSEPTAASTQSRADFIQIGYDFISDDATLIANSSDSDFPVANVQDRRVGKKWQGENVHTASGGLLTFNYVIRIPFASAKTIEHFFLTGHNFSSIYLSNRDLYLCAHTSDLGNTGATWIGSADYVVQLSTLLGRDLIAHRPSDMTTDPTVDKSYRYWAVVFSATCADTARAISFAPYIGRLALIQRSDVWRPRVNFDNQYTREYRDLTEQVETEDESIRATIKSKRWRNTFRFPTAPTGDWRYAWFIFREVGRGGELFVLPVATEISSGTSAPAAYTGETSYGPIYGYLDADLNLTGMPVEHSTFDLQIYEFGGQEQGD